MSLHLLGCVSPSIVHPRGHPLPSLPSLRFYGRSQLAHLGGKAIVQAIW